FYNHQNAADATLQGAGLGETYKFDSVDSLRARAGMRITKDLSNRNSWYAGLAYEYEFDGDASANVKGFSTETPSLGGGSGLIEAGYTYGGANDSFGTGIGLEGWVGTKRGFIINGSAHWIF
ncbi:MAG: autotransporter domain-containing protein, partial [Veillonella sp.]|nr:autotransporter domain-containing protein [Veillonella sp.]